MVWQPIVIVRSGREYRWRAGAVRGQAGSAQAAARAAAKALGDTASARRWAAVARSQVRAEEVGS